jgi:hypothetical protein
MSHDGTRKQELLCWRRPAHVRLRRERGFFPSGLNTECVHTVHILCLNLKGKNLFRDTDVDGLALGARGSVVG